MKDAVCYVEDTLCNWAQRGKQILLRLESYLNENMFEFIATEHFCAILAINECSHNASFIPICTM